MCLLSLFGGAQVGPVANLKCYHTFADYLLPPLRNVWNSFAGEYYGNYPHTLLVNQF